MRRTRTLITVAVAIVALATAASCVLRVAVVSGNSMAPAFHDGQVVLAIGSRWVGSGPRRGAVALVRHGGDVLIKRIVFVPGDVISPPDSDMLDRVRLFFDKAPVPRQPTTPGERLRVPAGQVVVLGDNRAISDDSRSFGPVALRDILGYVLGDPARR